MDAVLKPAFWGFFCSSLTWRMVWPHKQLCCCSWRHGDAAPEREGAARGWGYRQPVLPPKMLWPEPAASQTSSSSC